MKNKTKSKTNKGHKKQAKHSNVAQRHIDKGTKPKPPHKFAWVFEVIFVSLVVFAVLSLALVLFLAATNHRKAQSAVKTVSDIILPDNLQSYKKQIKSTLGYELTINEELQSVEAIVDNPDGKSVKKDSQAYEAGPYNAVNVFKKVSTPQASTNVAPILAKSIYITVRADNSKNIIEKLKLKYGQNKSDLDLLKQYFAPNSSADKIYSLKSSEEVDINGVKMIKNSYEIVNRGIIDYNTKQVDYITYKNETAYKVSLYENEGFDSQDLPAFNSVIESLRFFNPNDQKNSQNTNGKKTISDGLPLLSQFTANAESEVTAKDSNVEVVLNNQPSVVRIVSTYCMDFNLILGSTKYPFKGACSVSSGSGFIITPDGYVATNGHVVNGGVKDALLFSVLSQNMPVVKSFLNIFVSKSALDEQKADAIYKLVQEGDPDAIKILAYLVTKIPADTKVEITNEKGYYAVQLSNEAAKLDIKNPTNFEYTDNVVKAQLVDLDYNPNLNITKDGLNSADVAILKLDGNKSYPYSMLGSIDGLDQGSALTVIGFPGSADNLLVSSKESVPTQTKGVVSAVRTASGSNNKLIQSDVDISPGNSGGPGYDESGRVVGIATYVMTSESGKKTSYLTDINDLKKLLAKNNINLPDKISGEQLLWAKGLEKFSKAYYTSAIKDFKQVKTIYPAHRLVDQFIARAEEAKKQGKEAIEPSTYLIIIIFVALLIILPAIIFYLIVRRNKSRKGVHDAYTAKLATQTQNSPTAQQSNINTQSVQPNMPDGSIIQRPENPSVVSEPINGNTPTQANNVNNAQNPGQLHGAAQPPIRENTPGDKNIADNTRL